MSLYQGEFNSIGRTIPHVLSPLDGAQCAMTYNSFKISKSCTVTSTNWLLMTLMTFNDLQSNVTGIETWYTNSV